MKNLSQEQLDVLANLVTLKNVNLETVSKEDLELFKEEKFEYKGYLVLPSKPCKENTVMTDLLEYIEKYGQENVQVVSSATGSYLGVMVREQMTDEEALHELKTHLKPLRQAFLALSRVPFDTAEDVLEQVRDFGGCQ